MFVVENALLCDLPDVLALQRIAFEREALRYGDWSIPALVQSLDQLREEFSRLRVLVAREDGRIVGSVRAGLDAGGTAHVGRLVVSPDRQRRGIGGALLRAIEEACPEAVRFELFTGADSADNIRFYEQHGYRRFDTRRPSGKVPFAYMDKHRGGAGGI
jgi:GNAT superfamily N-acetyltransferase